MGFDWRQVVCHHERDTGMGHSCVYVFTGLQVFGFFQDGLTASAYWCALHCGGLLTHSSVGASTFCCSCHGGGIIVNLLVDGFVHE